jgi:hypothetical protein
MQDRKGRALAEGPASKGRAIDGVADTGKAGIILARNTTTATATGTTDDAGETIFNVGRLIRGNANVQSKIICLPICDNGFFFQNLFHC